jgi:hypothetical protein
LMISINLFLLHRHRKSNVLLAQQVYECVAIYMEWVARQEHSGSSFYSRMG